MFACCRGKEIDIDHFKKMKDKSNNVTFFNENSKR